MSAWATPEWSDGYAVASDSPKRRSLTLDQGAEEVAISKAQTYPLVRRAELRAVKVGGRGIWRIAASASRDSFNGTYPDTVTLHVGGGVVA